MESAFLDVSLDTPLSFYGLRLINFQLSKIGIALLLFIKFYNSPSFFKVFLLLLVHILIMELLFFIDRLVKLFVSFF